MTSFPAKGEIVPLQYTKQARHRINIGIGWDVREEIAAKPRAFVPEKTFNRGIEDQGVGEFEEFNPYVETIDAEIGQVVETFDVDLIALIFDAKGNLVDAVSPVPDEEVDRSGKIYHSGDETEGVSGGDDETISVELNGLPDYIHQVVFLATAQSGHDFSEILNSEARVVDSMSNRELLKVSSGGKAGQGMTGFVFAKIVRGGDTGWMLHNISEFRVDADVADWAEEVKPFLI